MLPLIGLNPTSFGTDKFVNSFIDETNKYIVVQLNGHISTLVSNHANYRFGYTKDEFNYAVFEVPEFYKPDVEKFRQGKYSQFSEQAKALIRKKSGLKYRIPKLGGYVETDKKLMALDKDPLLRSDLEERLGVKIDEEAELASIPGEDNFLQLELVTV